MAKIAATVGTQSSPGVLGVTPVGPLQKRPEALLLEREDALATLNAAIADAGQATGATYLSPAKPASARALWSADSRANTTPKYAR